MLQSFPPLISVTCQTLKHISVKDQSTKLLGVLRIRLMNISEPELISIENEGEIDSSLDMEHEKLYLEL